MTTAVIALSIIAPLYNEEESVRLLYDKIREAADLTKLPYEIIFVDDGSSDDTLGQAGLLAQDDHRLRVVEFRRNYGQTPAMAAGIDIARGDILVTMDGDLQNDPGDIPMMIDKLNEGYDLVVGWRYKRKDKLISRKIPSIVANKLIGHVTGVPIKDNGCSLKVYRASVVKYSPFYSEMHRFIPALLSLSGAKVAEVKVRHHSRQFGESKYGLSRIYKVLIDLLTIKTILSLGQHPIRWFFKLAFLPFMVSFSMIFMAYISNDFMTTNNLIFPTLGTLFFTLGVFLMSLGVMCELIYFKGKFKLKDVKSLALNKV